MSQRNDEVPAVSVPWQWLAELAMHPLQPRVYRAILDGGPTSPADLSMELDEPLATVSYHVTKLADQGLLELDRTVPIRGAVKHFYRVASTPDRYRSTS
ncbi:MAG: helix-turn-helix transcriptional regulator [Solirubrobacterales bacterium]|nr:helix-turn-helix transcriptional regulator [Solirubrobacterales bacterium]